MTVLALAAAPAAEAHPDECEVTLHQGGIQGHYLCTSMPNTCFVNQQVTGSVQAHVLCQEPESQPCLAKLVLAVATLKCGGGGPVPTELDTTSP